jgi:hypothetical protein
MFLSGCSTGPCPGPAVVTVRPDIIYPKYDTSKKIDIKAKRRGDEIIISINEFKRITREMSAQKYQIKTLQGIIDSYNKLDSKVDK